MAEFINPLTDIGFKIIFGKENVSNEILMDFLNALFQDDPVYGNIVSLKYLNSERNRERIDGRGINYDIFCETSTGHRYIVEMQREGQANFFDRAVYYCCRAVAEQGYKGKLPDDQVWDYKVVPIVTLCFCNFTLDELSKKEITYISLSDEETNERTGRALRLIFIQLPCFDKSASNCETWLDQWIYTIKNMNKMEAMPFQREVFNRLAAVG
ncbi:MAG: Rpn family recombination-promoting nuclease/putative transposase, partial [Clostridium sp.]|nr:Rpn family recombination-promoting nuclease/putative transposase [Clostridium sp.]